MLQLKSKFDTQCVGFYIRIRVIIGTYGGKITGGI
jgi:hypothetical protein